MVGIYKIDSPTGKVYIGQSWDISERFRSHKKDSKRDKFRQYPIYNSIKKHGIESHVFSTLTVLPNDITQEVLDAYEIFTLSQYKEAGYELLNVSGGGSRGKHSEETKRKIGEKSRQKVFTDEYRAKLRARPVNYTMLGKTHTPEARLKISQANKGKRKSDEQKRKIGDACRGLNHYNWGKKLAPETIEKLRVSSSGANSATAKKVENLNTGEIYPTAKIAGERNGINYSTLRVYLQKNTHPFLRYLLTN